MSVVTPDMMSVDFVARCLAGKAKAGSGKNKYGTFEPITIVTPLLTPVNTIPDEKVNSEPFFTENWTCDPQFVFNGYYRGSYAGVIFCNMPSLTLDNSDILDYDSTRIIVGCYFGNPIIISTKQEDCRLWRSYDNRWIPPVPDDYAVEYNGLKWYYGGMGGGVNGNYTDSAGTVYPYTGDWAYTWHDGESYPTEEMILGILAVVNPQPKEEMR